MTECLCARQRRVAQHHKQQHLLQKLTQTKHGPLLLATRDDMAGDVEPLAGGAEVAGAHAQPREHVLVVVEAVRESEGGGGS